MLLILQTIALLALVARSVLAQFDEVTSGFFTMGTISVEGGLVVPFPGSYPGVFFAPQDPENPSYVWAVVEYPQGWVLHLAAGNAYAGSGDNVKLGASYPGTFWNISEHYWHEYTIQTLDGNLGWILPQFAPTGTQVTLKHRAPGDPVTYMELFTFASVL